MTDEARIALRSPVIANCGQCGALVPVADPIHGRWWRYYTEACPPVGVQYVRCGRGHSVHVKRDKEPCRWCALERAKEKP